MKKLFYAIIIALSVIIVPAFAAEPKFNISYGDNFRLYDYSEYLEGNYRSNFVSIPQNRMLNYKDGFKWSVGVFELDGNTLYLGWRNHENATLQLCDEDNNFYLTKDSWETHEESYFYYGDYVWGGVVTHINLKGKEYTVAVAGISTDRAEIYSNFSGFRMWVENEAPKDTAKSKTVNNWLNYDSADILEGVYKPGWKRLWGTIEKETRNYRYTYKGEEFVCNWDNDAVKAIQNPDGTQLPLKNISGAYMSFFDKDGTAKYGYGIGIEADAQIGKNKVRIAVLSYDGYKRVFVKDTTGYPVLPVKKAAPAKKVEKAKGAKVSEKSASFVRDYKSDIRIYAKDDVLNGVYKSNYKSIPQKDSTTFGITWTPNDGGEKKKYDINAGLFDIGICEVAFYYHPDLGWDIIPFTEANRTENWKLNRNVTFAIEDGVAKGIEAQVLRNGKFYNNIAIVPVDLEKAEYKLFVKTGPDTETALNEKDDLGFEYYDYLDMRSGVYKPGFEKVSGVAAKEEAYKKLFEGSGHYDRVDIYDYKGAKFLIGPTQDPATAVKNLDGTVIHNPETQIRYKYTDEKGSVRMTGKYGWEGKVKLGDKDVILAVIKWDYNVSVFVKEVK